jgi:uncharacterized lipoprotein NlpE involved in copper resistance
MLSNLSKLAALSLSLLLFAGCDNDDDDAATVNQVYNLRGNANSAQEAPTRVTTAATGTITGTYNKQTNALQYTINWTGLEGGNPVAMHFHGPADPGVAAGIVVPITGFPTTATGTYTGNATVTDAQETELLNGLWYYNIHNATYPGGEIRGQVFLTQ